MLDSDLMVSAEVVSEEPEVIEYKVNPEAVWSDGDPIDCDDFYLQWIASNGTLTELDNAGKPVVDETGAEVLLFAPAATTGFEDIGEIECSEDGKTITTTYKTKFADWQGNFQDMVPAHVVEREAGVDDLIAAYESEDRGALEKLATAYKTIFTPDPGKSPRTIFVSGDAFKISESGRRVESMTLTQERELLGHPGERDSIVIRLVAEEAQAQALANGEINLMNPQPTPDLLTNLEGIDGVTVETGSTSSCWSTSTSTSGRRARKCDIKVRQAFAKCLPREQMLTNLIQPMAPEAPLLNNRWVQDFEAGLQGHLGRWVRRRPTSRVRRPCSPRRRARRRSTVRLGWNVDTGNQRRVDQIAATQQSCAEAGFDVVDTGTETFFEGDLDQGETWDVAMFGWFGSPAEDRLAVELHHRWWQQQRPLLEQGSGRPQRATRSGARHGQGDRAGEPDRHDPVAGPRHDPAVQPACVYCMERHGAERRPQPVAERANVERQDMGGCRLTPTTG